MLTVPKAILLDMDGTLTCPLLDFARIKREMKIPVDQPILEAMARMTEQERAVANEVLLRHEDHAADHSALNAGCHELLNWIAAKKIATAIVTRNSRRSVERVMKIHHLPIEVSITRDDGLFKPDPAPLKLACKRLGVSIERSMMVGDGAFDIEAGIAAGMRTVWISHRHRRTFTAKPSIEVEDLPALLRWLENIGEFR